MFKITASEKDFLLNRRTLVTAMEGKWFKVILKKRPQNWLGVAKHEFARLRFNGKYDAYFGKGRCFSDMDEDNAIEYLRSVRGPGNKVVYVSDKEQKKIENNFKWCVLRILKGN